MQEAPKNDDDLIKNAMNLTYHIDAVKKINISKIDTSLAFGFYLRDY